jgi:hypothetical protein
LLEGEDKELLCFDCFRVAPHYHYRKATVKKNERLMLDFTAEGDSLAWTLDKIKNRHANHADQVRGGVYCPSNRPTGRRRRSTQDRRLGRDKNPQPSLAAQLRFAGMAGFVWDRNDCLRGPSFHGRTGLFYLGG